MYGLRCYRLLPLLALAAVPSPAAAQGSSVATSPAEPCHAYKTARSLVSAEEFDRLYKRWRCLPASVAVSIDVERAAPTVDLTWDYESRFNGEFHYYEGSREFTMVYPSNLGEPRVELRRARGTVRTRQGLYRFTEADAVIRHPLPGLEFYYQAGSKHVAVELQSHFVEWTRDECDCSEASPPQAWIGDGEVAYSTISPEDVLAKLLHNQAFEATFEWQEVDDWVDRFRVKLTVDTGVRLESLRVASGATQKNVTGDENWATPRSADGVILVEALTTPDTVATAEQIRWSGDVGSAVPGKPNQRKLTAASSRVFTVEAELGGVRKKLRVWVVSAEVEILTRGTVPQGAPKFPAGFRDGTQTLGAVRYQSVFPTGDAAAGKIAAVARLTPEDVEKVVTAGWGFEREAWTHIWYDGKKHNPGDRKGDSWNTTWVPDSTPPGGNFSFAKLVPDKDGRIYDLDAPNIGNYSPSDVEYYSNFRQWVEWNGERCSDYAHWYWRARLKATASPQVTLMEVGGGSIELPKRSFFHP